MREVNFWDLLVPAHFVLIILFVGALCLEFIFLKRSLKNKKVLGASFFVVCILVTLFLGFVVRSLFFPGGTLNDSRYRADRSEAQIVQENLKEYKNENGTYPTTEQGLNALSPMRKQDPKCKLEKNFYPKFKYISDGKTYEIESADSDGDRGPIVYGTDKQAADLFIRK